MKEEMLPVAESSPHPRSPMIDLLESIGVANLTSKVTAISHPPIFQGTFSDVYQGVSQGELVCCTLLFMNLLLSYNLGGHQGYKDRIFQGNHGKGEQANAIDSRMLRFLERNIAEKSKSGGVFSILTYSLVLAS
jgi:hypothetical protein